MLPGDVRVWVAAWSLVLAALPGGAWACDGADADGDGICDTDEDRDGDGDLEDDDRDDDGTPDWLDDDDDGDLVPTAEEDWDGDGDPTNDDRNGNDVADYLDVRVPTDDDGDGYRDEQYGGDDCDDADPLFHPGAFDPWYDGFDFDCDGANDFDQDADGHEDFRRGGDDCDDVDPLVNPGMEEDTSEIDRDCDGWTDPDRRLLADGGCDCAHGGLPLRALPPVLIALALVRRRRR